MFTFCGSHSGFVLPQKKTVATTSLVSNFLVSFLPFVGLASNSFCKLYNKLVSVNFIFPNLLNKLF